ncbi:hypothetical protein DAEQUDRAFT_319045 [Daedalea quercina L-15889]|uniref:Uncharacterized protein n=1 Tax=Daedalea quercina L-15889 TaxID=1314783 RepID=A0A165PXG2_9APHY|nr:hypothetical protein DAEQUDRAFT_319045 [Daedalea quercina L-15889]
MFPRKSACHSRPSSHTDHPTQSLATLYSAALPSCVFHLSLACICGHRSSRGLGREWHCELPAIAQPCKFILQVILLRRGIMNHYRAGEGHSQLYSTDTCASGTLG